MRLNKCRPGVEPLQVIQDCRWRRGARKPLPCSCYRREEKQRAQCHLMLTLQGYHGRNFNVPVTALGHKMATSTEAMLEYKQLLGKHRIQNVAYLSLSASIFFCFFFITIYARDSQLWSREDSNFQSKKYDLGGGGGGWNTPLMCSCMQAKAGK